MGAMATRPAAAAAAAAESVARPLPPPPPASRTGSGCVVGTPVYIPTLCLKSKASAPCAQIKGELSTIEGGGMGPHELADTTLLHSGHSCFGGEPPASLADRVSPPAPPPPRWAVSMTAALLSRTCCWETQGGGGRLLALDPGSQRHCLPCHRGALPWLTEAQQKTVRRRDGEGDLQGSRGGGREGGQAACLLGSHSRTQCWFSPPLNPPHFPFRRRILHLDGRRALDFAPTSHCGRVKAATLRSGTRPWRGRAHGVASARSGG